MMSAVRGRAQSGAQARLARAGLILAALLGYLALSGCGSISVNDTTPTAPLPGADQVAPAPRSGPRHDLAILGVDFDPALDVQRLARHEPVTLIVGVSNQGNQRESNVTIRADLWNTNRTERLLHVTQTVDAITAGNVLAVRLTTANTPPFLTRYHLTVEIDSVPGETNTRNNTRDLDIVVNDD